MKSEDKYKTVHVTHDIHLPSGEECTIDWRKPHPIHDLSDSLWTTGYNIWAGMVSRIAATFYGTEEQMWAIYPWGEDEDEH